MTQVETVKNHLKKHKTITTMDAFMKYGITRLAARIKDLRDDGEKIGAYYVHVRNRFGDLVKVKRYYLGGKK